ncbi:MAG: HpcH/HpaI aldolase/citrate lyase family protein [Ardenticatenaceae bacterium]|nr:HpcH/HpaI aldolase/citrate lyase family protein [Ardenticatenaceae bacterium]
MELSKNKFKAKLAQGDLQIGLWSSLSSPVVAEIIAHSPLDWVCLDTEHAPNELPNLVAQMRALAAGNVSVMVRPAWNDMVLIKRVLDAGAQTLILPYVQNGAEARAAVAATRYPPHGVRGVAASTRAAAYGRNKNYLHQAGDEIAVILQIETIEALNRLEEIAYVDGVDGVFIGPSDLSASMGHLGNPQHEDVQSAIQEGISRLKEMGKPGGILSYNPVEAQKYIDWGFRFIAAASDQSILLRGVDSLVGHFR